MFAIVQEKTKIEIIPENWIVTLGGRVCVMRPPQKSGALYKDPKSKPILDGESRWIIGAQKVKARGFDSYEFAESICNKMRSEPDTDPDVQRTPKTRNQCGKKLETRCAAISAITTIPTITLPDQILASPPVYRTKAMTKFITASTNGMKAIFAEKMVIYNLIPPHLYVVRYNKYRESVGAINLSSIATKRRS